MGSLGPLVSEIGLPAGTLSGWVLVAVVVLALVKAWPALRKLQIEEDGSLRGDLMKRIEALETRLADEQRACTEQLYEMRRDYEARMAAQGRQIDDLQREIFNLRRAALRLLEGAQSGADLTALALSLSITDTKQ